MSNNAAQSSQRKLPVFLQKKHSVGKNNSIRVFLHFFHILLFGLFIDII